MSTFVISKAPPGNSRVLSRLRNTEGDQYKQWSKDRMGKHSISEQRRVCVRDQLIKAVRGRKAPSAVAEQDCGTVGKSPPVWELA